MRVILSSSFSSSSSASSASLIILNGRPLKNHPSQNKQPTRLCSSHYFPLLWPFAFHPLRRRLRPPHGSSAAAAAAAAADGGSSASSSSRCRCSRCRSLVAALLSSNACRQSRLTQLSLKKVRPAIIVHRRYSHPTCRTVASCSQPSTVSICPFLNRLSYDTAARRGEKCPPPIPLPSPPTA